MPKREKKQKSPEFKFDEQSLENLDKKTLVGLLLKMHEQCLYLTESVQTLMREKYGPKTERFVDSDQLRLFGDELKLDADTASPLGGATEMQPDSSKKPSSYSSSKKRSKHNPRPSNLNRVEYRGDATTENVLACPCCNSARTLVNEVSRYSRLAYVPATVHEEIFIASIFACTKCGNTIAVEPNIPAGALNMQADPALVASIAVERFEDSLPLHRQERRFDRLGVSIARSTMCGWLSTTSKLLRPITDKMKTILLQSKVIATDDSPIKVQDRCKSKNIKIGRVWTYIGDDYHPVNLFDYTSGRGRAGPLKFISGFKGFLLGDCFSGNQALCAQTGSIHVACHAHARRYWIKAEPSNKAACAEILKLYAQLFQIERDAKDLDITGTQLKLMREQESKPILVTMKNWLDRQALIALPKSSLGKAINYCLNNWTELNNYLLDGDLRIDNNLAEQQMKRFAVNRKNSLFFGSDNGGRDAEVFMSLISTCRRHNVDPWAYLKDVIEKLSEDPGRELDLLLPHTWISAEIQPVLDTPKIASLTLKS